MVAFCRSLPWPGVLAIVLNLAVLTLTVLAQARW